MTARALALSWVMGLIGRGRSIRNAIMEFIGFRTQAGIATNGATLELLNLGVQLRCPRERDQKCGARAD